MGTGILAAFWAIGFISGITLMIGINYVLLKEKEPATFNNKIPNFLPKRSVPIVRPAYTSDKMAVQRERDGEI